MRVSLSSIVPGWNFELIPEAATRVAEGHHKQSDRLRGSRFALVVVRSEFDLDGLTESLEIGAGFANEADARAEADFQVIARAADEIRRRRQDRPSWRYLGNSAPTAKIPSAVYGTVIKVGDGGGFNSVYHHACVVHLDPTNPLGSAFVQELNLNAELAHYFMLAAG